MIYNDKPGFMDKDDIIKSMASEIERLEKVLREHRHMAEVRRNDILKVMDENVTLRNELHKQAQRMHGSFATWHDPKEGSR